MPGRFTVEDNLNPVSPGLLLSVHAAVCPCRKRASNRQSRKLSHAAWEQTRRRSTAIRAPWCRHGLDSLDILSAVRT